MGDTLATLVEEVQYEIGHAATPAVGKNFREHTKSRIRREYRRLYHDFDWPHLQLRYRTDLAAGQRYYDFPAGITLETVQSLHRWWGNRWDELDRDIPFTCFNLFDSDADARNEPAMRWAPYNDDQIEIWPIPSTDIANGLGWFAKRAFTPLVDEDDRCDLDTDLVVLHAAAELARRWSNEDANILLARAVKHYETLKSRSQRGGVRANFTAGEEPKFRKGFADKLIIGVDRG